MTNSNKKGIFDVVMVATLLSIMCITLSGYTQLMRTATGVMTDMFQQQEAEPVDYDAAFGVKPVQNTDIMNVSIH